MMSVEQSSSSGRVNVTTVGTGIRAAALLAAGLLALSGCSSTSSWQPVRSASPSSPTSTQRAQGTQPATRWQPTPGTGWQWQLTGAVDTSVDAPVYDVDLFTTPASTVARLHAAGRKVICYVNVGAAEDFRADYQSFPAMVVGAGNGWPGEKWLDVRRIDVIGPVMARRLDLCREKGFDGVEPDNVDGYDNSPGFPLTAADQLTYNRYIAGLAHDRGLAVGLKNDLAQIPQLVPSFDFAVNEQCFEFDECDELTPFVAAGKAAFSTEYSGSTSEFCPAAKAMRLSALLKHQQLDAWRQAC
jgi:hypothetical protein